EAMYTDDGQLWQTLTWQDPDTAETFATYQYVGGAYPLVAESFYLDEEGATWGQRTWQDPDTGETWDTYENLGFAASQQGWAGQRQARRPGERRIWPGGAAHSAGAWAGCAWPRCASGWRRGGRQRGGRHVARRRGASQCDRGQRTCRPGRPGRPGGRGASRAG